MTPFIDKLKISPISNDMSKWALEDNFRYQIYDLIINIPKGFETDFASVPKIFWNILPPFGKYGKPAILHDFLYREGKINNKFITRKLADKLFLYAMNEIGVKRSKRNLMYSAVRLFAGSIWKGYRKQNKLNFKLKVRF